MHFSTLKEAQLWIESVYRFSDKYDLKRMEKACAMLNHPERDFKSVHIGGTNGKGSTLTYLKHIFLEAGYTVGTYTSPYIVSFNERITLNNEDIPDVILLKYINQIYDLHRVYLSEENDQISFFELVTLISFLYFRDTKPDIALIEVGLGGTLDATNVITPTLSIITTIGSDHLHILGPTINDVAKQKLGIVKPGVPLISGHEQPFLDSIFEARCKKMDCDYRQFRAAELSSVELGNPTTFHYLEEPYTLNMAGLHQVHNAALALLAAHYLNTSMQFTIPLKAMQTGLKKAFWPGRFEVFGNIIIDGAHNLESLESCFDTVKAYFPNKTIISLFTVMKDKDYTAMLDVLVKQTQKVFFTEIDHPRCESAETLLSKSNHPNAYAYKDLTVAFEKAQPQTAEAVLIVTGSLYFISEIRSMLLKQRQ